MSEGDLTVFVFIGFCVLLIIIAFRFFIFCIVEDVKTHNEMKINDRYLEKEAELKELRNHNININHNNKNEE